MLLRRLRIEMAQLPRDFLDLGAQSELLRVEIDQETLEVLVHGLDVVEY